MISENNRRGLLIRLDGSSEFLDVDLLTPGVKEGRITYRDGVYREINKEREGEDYTTKIGFGD